MKWSTLVLSLLPLVSAAPKQPKAPKTFSQRVVFTPPNNYTDPRVLYARTAQFKDGTLLATWENYSPEPPLVYFPIYKSTDGGYNWKELSHVQDTENGLGTHLSPEKNTDEQSSNNPQAFATSPSSTSSPSPSPASPPRRSSSRAVPFPRTSPARRSTCTPRPTAARPGPSSRTSPRAAPPSPTTA